jgi:deoxyribonucleoside regulator
VVQLNGGLARGQTITNASELVRRFSSVFGADSYGLNVPAIVDSTEICRAIYSDSNIRQALDLAHSANICMFSIGALSHMSVLVEAGYIAAEDVTTLKGKGAVGDICSRYIDVHGRVPDEELNARTIGIELDELRRKQTTIAIAGGMEKLNAIRGALAGGYCNVLITDETVARALC